MCNPVIIDRSEDIVCGEEGCLSLPGVWASVSRSKDIQVKFQDQNGKETKLNLEDMNARVVQHELDHLDGILFLDKVDGSITVEKDVDLGKLDIEVV